MVKPTILVDGHVLDGSPQGSGAYLAGLYGAVSREGMARVVICCHYESSVTRWFPDAPDIEWEPLQSTERFTRLALELPKLQARIRPDFAHFNYICPLRKTGPWINVIHDLLFLDYSQYFPLSYRLRNATLFRISAMRSDKVLTSSQYSRDAIHRHFGIPRERIHVVPAAPDAFAGAPDEVVPNLTPGRFAVYVSRFEPRKNQHALVRSFHEIVGELDPDQTLVLVGAPALGYPELDDALALAGERVRPLSNISHEQLTWLYRNACASIYPSHAEGFGMPIIEAVAAGGTSYCANNTAMSELVPYVHGSFDANDHEQIKATVRRAFGEGRQTRDNRVRERVLETFSWKASAYALIEALRA
ncbi:glycosyl transferase family 1 [Erythrobacter sp. Dej080120_24]|uniref:glycosyltransferase family 4 protein n=1 Tax=Erythrobacter sp. Dej080120_24 TaxID=3024837 RepID=UPI002924D825|nr:glycosyl transferase family 1 [Erythrobacter sp. Dej080120_24]